ncbi:tRNA glutamyl-Q(34) synthetase GluQRS [Celeribacter arenosi]|uniref:tRNA glutamyl-Q(34) synthetase GluQRS n=1 Tax=Celeribacter arenosi TaxID=792649 RepID=A0ABP7KFI0_9RHOB
MQCITRFAPSPTGPLHLGHAFSALTAFRLAQSMNGRFLLRIEDIDQSRARPQWEAQIYNDLAWLGLTWETPVLRQSDNLAAYSRALDLLWEKGLLYPCSCNRRDISAAASAPQEGAPLQGPDGIIYPGTCRPTQPPTGPRPYDVALRLDIAKATQEISHVEWDEAGPDCGHHSIPSSELITSIGDVVLARRDMGTSYHLSVVVDDAAQAITHVVRGEDLAPATPIHVLLQTLMGFPTAAYYHHTLIRDEAGKRLAKRDDARALSTYRDMGKTPADIREMVGLA